jgi:hypothetical protein
MPLYDWTEIPYFTSDELNEYLDTLSEDEYAYELQSYSKYHARSILKEEMKKVNNFYDFVKNYSPCDYKVIQNKPYISQRVISTHIEIWNEINDIKIKHLQVFFI